MTQSFKVSIALVLAVVIGGAIYGAYQYPKAVFTGSPAGSTFSSAKYAGATVSLASPGANGTSTSILNSDASDRIITGLRGGCEVLASSKTAYTGTGLAALTLSAATTSTANANFPATSNIVGGAALTIPTSTPSTAFASSTGGVNASGISTSTIVWAAGSYLTFQFNATNTAACTVGADYVGS